jgi:hypothetical protein
MENPIRCVAQRIDDALMYGANRAVKAWNWTTGETKSDLANKFLVGASIAEVSACATLALELRLFSVPSIIAGSSLVYTHREQKINKESEDKEILAMHINAKDFLVERRKISNRVWGPAAILFSGMFYLMASDLYRKSEALGDSYVLLGTGGILRAASYYIMRTDTLPPRKDCVRRGIDHVKEMLEGIKSASPTPAYAHSVQCRLAF